MYRLVRGLAGLLFHLVADVRMEGVENVPSGGALLLAMNHLSYIDPPLILITVPRRITVFAARKYHINPFLRLLFESMGCIWVRQAEADLDALRAALKFLRSGGVLGLSPEGTRSRITHALLRARSGVAYLASRSGAAVLPVAVWGTEHLLRDLMHFRRGKLHVRIGRTFHLEASPHDKGAALDAATDEIMCALAALLPPEYRGEYGNHPRLEEWLRRMNA